MCMTYYETYNNWGNIEYDKKAHCSAATAIAGPPLPLPSQRLSIVCRQHVGNMSATQPDVGKFGQKCVLAATRQGKKEVPHTANYLCVVLATLPPRLLGKKNTLRPRVNHAQRRRQRRLRHP